MARYAYKAKAGPGKTVSGELDAENERAALARIDAMGYSPVWVRAATAARGGAAASGRGVRGREVSVFTRQLASLIRAGVSILRALQTIRAQTPNRRMATVVREIEEAVRDGRMLSESMAAYPRLFPELYLNLVRSGETSGLLDTMLDRIAAARDRDEEVTRRVRSALAYPLLMLLVGLVTIAVLLGYLLPSVAGLFPDPGALPWPTRALLRAGEWFQSYGLAAGVAAILAALALRQGLRTGGGRVAADALLLRLPLFGTFLRQAELARFARTLSLLLRSGISIERALELAGDTLDNRVLRAEVAEARRGAVQQGRSVAAALGAAPHFPPYVVNMVAVGEEGGSLDDTLGEVAAYYEREVEMTTRVVTALLEPVLVLGVGAVVGFIVFAMLLPIFEIGEVVR